jgi:uncharacterized protein (TIGR03067 family)
MHRSRVLVSAFLLLLPVTLMIAAQRDANDRTGLEGTWTAVSAEGFGADVPKEELQNLEVKFTGDRITAKYGRKTAEGRYSVRAGKEFKELDVTLTQGPDDFVNKLFPGIFRLDGDRLMVVYRQPGEARPTQVDRTGQSGHFKIVFKRGGQ